MAPAIGQGEEVSDTVPVPVACTLDGREFAEREVSWQDLAQRALVDATATTGGVRLRYRPAPGVQDDLEALAAGERACCRWASWAVTADDGAIVLEATSEGDGVVALQRAFLPTPAAPG